MLDDFIAISFWVLMIVVFFKVGDMFENSSLYKHIIGSEVQCSTPNKKVADS